jgi:hypothetical protein
MGVTIADRLGSVSELRAEATSERAVKRAIEAAWNLLCRKKGDVSASEIMKFVRERVPGIDPDRVRIEFARRLRRRSAKW